MLASNKCLLVRNAFELLRQFRPANSEEIWKKNKHIDSLYPYKAKKNDFTQNISDSPPGTYPVTNHYFMFKLSPYSAAEMRAYKSLDAYNQVLEYWKTGLEMSCY